MEFFKGILWAVGMIVTLLVGFVGGILANLFITLLSLLMYVAPLIALALFCVAAYFVAFGG